MNAISSSKLVNGLFGNGPQMNILVIDEGNGSRSILSVKRTEATEHYILNNSFHPSVTEGPKFNPKVKFVGYQTSNFEQLTDKRKKDRIRDEDGYDNLKTMSDSKKQRVFRKILERIKRNRFPLYDLENTDIHDLITE